MRGRESKSLFPEPAAVPLILDKPSPSAAGTITTTPRGFLLHSSRSGIAHSEMDEFEATVRYAVGGANGLSWHATIGPGIVAIHLTPRQWGWNCREESPFWIAVEFAQGLLGGPISDEQIDAFCWYARDEVLPTWPDLPHVLKMHSELPPGVRDGKSDPYPAGSSEGEAFKAKIRERLGW